MAVHRSQTANGYNQRRFSNQNSLNDRAPINEEVFLTEYQRRNIREITVVFFKEVFAGILEALNAKKDKNKT